MRAPSGGVISRLHHGWCINGGNTFVPDPPDCRKYYGFAGRHGLDDQWGRVNTVRKGILCEERTMKGMISLIAVMSISAVLVLGQAPHALKPGPEHQKLSAFVGNWTFEGEAKASPMGPAGKVTG